METKPSRHFFHYMPLAIILIGGLYSLLFLTPTRTLKIEALTVMLIAYMLWGVVHHALEHTLHWGVIVEFLSFALFLFTLVAVLLYVV